eukprot:TRINITY_DN1853_c0_g2_i2.p1 TRINITY_DN1853_c0_g2~~TRINITY_DN1853_c0_g2_i2.p1  ORF type:complete len:349 (+),score=128.36 TRINITY_DN1853_c0_g2_i2:183-1229(+)
MSRPLGPPKPLGAERKEYTLPGATPFVVSNRYDVSKQIGHGAYGFVCSAIDTTTGEKVAIKKIPRIFDDVVDGKRILREVKLLSFLNHENIISIKDVMRPSDKATFEDVYYVSELMDTDLHQIIRSDQQLTEEHNQYFIYQALRALKYIHSANVLHRDLKPGNLLVNGNCDLLICDFGLARGFDENELTGYVVTRWYRPPELLLLSHYTPAVDIWSLGCILAELMLRKPLFPGRDYLNQLNIITDVLGVPQEEDMLFVTSAEAARYLLTMRRKVPVPVQQIVPSASPECVDLLTKMLAFNPSKRISAADALKHPFLSKLHDPEDEPVSADQFYWDKVCCCGCLLSICA